MLLTMCDERAHTHLHIAFSFCFCIGFGIGRFSWFSGLLYVFLCVCACAFRHLCFTSNASGWFPNSDIYGLTPSCRSLVGPWMLRRDDQTCTVQVVVNLKKYWHIVSSLEWVPLISARSRVYQSRSFNPLLKAFQENQNEKRCRGPLQMCKYGLANGSWNEDQGVTLQICPHPHVFFTIADRPSKR